MIQEDLLAEYGRNFISYLITLKRLCFHAFEWGLFTEGAGHVSTVAQKGKTKHSPYFQ